MATTERERSKRKRKGGVATGGKGNESAHRAGIGVEEKGGALLAGNGRGQRGSKSDSTAPRGQQQQQQQHVLVRSTETGASSTAASSGGGGGGGGEGERGSKKRRKRRRKEAAAAAAAEAAAEAAKHLPTPPRPPPVVTVPPPSSSTGCIRTSSNAASTSRPANKTVKAKSKAGNATTTVPTTTNNNKERVQRGGSSSAARAAAGVPSGKRGGSEGGGRGGQGGDAGVGASGAPRLSELQKRMRQKLEGAQFRMINETLYTSESGASLAKFKREPELFDVYHRGFREQVEKWPVHPLDIIIDWLGKYPKARVADFGCGEARLAATVPNKVHSFDLVSPNPLVTACDMANVPIKDASVHVAVFCLSLMGTNLADFLREAYRVLVPGGLVKVAEVRSRFEGEEGGVERFLEVTKRLGFDTRQMDRSNKMFLLAEFKKSNRKPEKGVEYEAKACIYKRR